VAEGEISVKEYDYLLTMQIMSLTEERVIELEKQMRDKRAEYELLQKMHIYQMWQNDLAAFLEELDKYEAQEEKDRLAHGTGNGGKGKGKGGAKARKPAVTAGAKKPVNNENKKPSNKADGNSDQKKQTNMGDFMMKKDPKPKPKKKDDDDFDPEEDS
jgi:hypothetical protein